MKKVYERRIKHYNVHNISKNARIFRGVYKLYRRYVTLNKIA